MVAQRIAKGEIDPITYIEFHQNDEEDKIVQKVTKQREKKTLFLNGSDNSKFNNYHGGNNNFDH